MNSQRRAVFLIEMLTVLTMLAVGGSLMTLGLVSILKSQKRVTVVSNRYAQLNDFFRVFSHDVRTSRVVSLSVENGEGDKVEPRQVLLIGEAPRQVKYRFYKQYVERTGYERDTVAEKRWASMSTTVQIDDGQPASRGPIVKASVIWHQTGTQDPEPTRRFDLSVYGAGELALEGEFDATDATTR